MKARAVSGVLARGAAVLTWTAVVVLSGSAFAVGEPPARPSPQAALETLMQSSAGRSDVAPSVGAGAAAGAVGSSARNTIKVERGQSLDALIRQHLATSPLKVEVLRELIHQLNPKAFAPGSGHRLLAGVQLQLPTPEDQMRHAFGRSVGAQVHSREEVMDAASGAWGNGAAAAARRGWVRFP